MIIDGQFNMTYNPLPEDPQLAEVWARYDEESRLEHSVQGDIGMYVNEHPLLHIATDLDADEILHEDEPALHSYQLAKWFVDCWWACIHEDDELSIRNLEHRLDWHYDHCIGTIGNGNYWPDITIWSEDDEHNIIMQMPVFTRPEGYNFTGSDIKPTHCKIYRILKADLVSAIDDFVNSVLHQCEQRGFTYTGLHIIYEELLEERDHQ